MARVFIHELIHAVLGFPDLVGIDGLPLETTSGFNGPGYISNLADPNSDYLGQTVRLTNEIMSMVYGESPRGHYLNAQGEDGGVGGNINSPVDQVIHGAQTSVIDLFINRVGSTNPDGSDSRDLIIGGEGNETIDAGGGFDFVFGGGGNDLINGGAGSDTIEGGAGDDILAGNIRTTTQNNWEFASNILDGGEGNDRYYVTGNPFGNYFFDRIDAAADTISDSDGVGTVYVQSFELEPGDFNYVALRNLTFKPVESYGDEFPYDVEGWLAAQMNSEVWVFAGIAAGRTIIFNSNGNVLFILDTDTGLPLLGQEAAATLPPSHPSSILGMRFVNNMAIIQGTAGEDIIIGSTADDHVLAHEANDEVNAGAGNDLVEGGDGDDLLRGEAGYDDLQGGAGADTLEGGAGTDVLNGGDGDDILNGGADADRQYGGAGNDIIYVDHLDDVIDGGTGYDRLLAATGSLALNINLAVSNLEAAEGGNWNDVFDASGVSVGVELRGHGRNDILTGSAHDDLLDGGAGNDQLFGLDGVDTLDGSIGADELVAGAGDDILYVDADDTVIDGGADYDQIFVRGYSAGVNINMTTGNLEYANGNTQDDTFDASGATWSVKLFGQGGNDTLTGGDIGDQLYGSLGADIINGNGGNDIISGGAGADQLFGGAGDDIMFVDADDTIINGGADYDRVYVTAGSAGVTLNMTAAGVEFAYGGAGSDVFNAAGSTVAVKLQGRDGADTLTGGNLADLIYGGTGADNITGNGGNDFLSGGGADGAIDTFFFASGWGDDTLSDFQNNQDLMNFVSLGTNFAGLTITALGSNNSVVSFGGDSITLLGMQLADVDAGDFVFV